MIYHVTSPKLIGSPVSPVGGSSDNEWKSEGATPETGLKREIHRTLDGAVTVTVTHQTSNHGSK